MKRKICFFSGDITRSGGTERVAVQLVNALQKENVYDICIVSLTEQQEETFYSIDPSVKKYKLGNRWIKPGPGYLPLIGKLRRFLKEKQIDIIVDIDIVLDVLSIPAVKKLKTRVTSWEHFTADFELSVFYRRMILKYSITRSDYVVVLTDGDLTEYQNRLGRRTRISRIYNPVAFKPDVNDDNEKKNIILTVGRLVPEKGIEYLKEVSLKVLHQNPQWQWLVLGEGSERPDLERFILDNHLQNRLVLNGNVHNVD